MIIIYQFLKVFSNIVNRLIYEKYSIGNNNKWTISKYQYLSFLVATTLESVAAFFKFSFIRPAVAVSVGCVHITIIIMAGFRALKKFYKNFWTNNKLRKTSQSFSNY